MKKILGALVMGALGMMVFSAAIGLDHYDNRRIVWLIVSMLLNIGSVVLILYGLREFFLEGVISELRNLKK